jgi:hypothetical protein
MCFIGILFWRPPHITVNRQTGDTHRQVRFDNTVSHGNETLNLYIACTYFLTIKLPIARQPWRKECSRHLQP